uniref:Uncharacterized protein n=1 Tax=Romanomermis culicivorax TaxID=13658 RepID=A0A915JCJ4_ROMCU
MMVSPDFMDTVFGIGNDLNNQVYATAFDDLGKRYFGENGLEFNGARFIYMLYGAILTLPLTQKLEQHKIDALMVVKKAQYLNLAISYATNDGSLSLKILHFDGSFPFRKSTIEKSVIFDMQQILASVKGRKLKFGELDSAVREFFRVSFQHRTDEASFRFIPKISRVPYNAGHILFRETDFPKLVKIQESEFAKSATIFVEQLRSNNYDVVKYNIHALIRLLIMQHHIQTPFAKLQLTSVYNYYFFLIGALEMNWAHSYRLNVQPIVAQYKRIIHGMTINHVPEERVWKSEPIRSVVQLLTSAGLSSHELNAEKMYENMAKRVSISGSMLIGIGIDHGKLVNPLTQQMDIHSFELMTYTQLLDLNPWENLVDLLLKPFDPVDQSNRHKIKYCIENLNQMGRKTYRATAYTEEMLIHNLDFVDYLHTVPNLTSQSAWGRRIVPRRKMDAGVAYMEHALICGGNSGMQIRIFGGFWSLKDKA